MLILLQKVNGLLHSIYKYNTNEQAWKSTEKSLNPFYRVFQNNKTNFSILACLDVMEGLEANKVTFCQKKFYDNVTSLSSESNGANSGTNN